MINVIVTGAKGRMGSRICALAEESHDFKLVGKIDAGDVLEAVIAKADVVIDFTAPKASVQHAKQAATHQIPLVVGTTGLSDAERDEIIDAAKCTPIVFSPNMSVGVNLLFSLVTTAARTLANDYAIEIVETHHALKKDKPSGTAKALLDTVTNIRGKEAEKTIPLHSIREGQVVGDHTITFKNSGEELALTHHALSRDIFANGALTAARWVIGKPAGLYTMANVLGLKL